MAARTAAPRLAPHKLPPPATAPRATAPAHSTQHHQRTAGVRNHPLTAQLAADARSAPPRYSDVSCVIRKRLGASDAAPSSPIALPAHTAAPRPAPRKAPTTRYSLARNRPSPQHATSSAHLPAFASIRSQRSCRRCTQRTAEVQLRQLRHPSETRCQRRCPIISDGIHCTIACTHRRPSQNPYRPLQPRAQPPQSTARNIISAFAGVRNHPLTAQLAADACSVPLRSSDVS